MYSIVQCVCPPPSLADGQLGAPALGGLRAGRLEAAKMLADVHFDSAYKAGSLQRCCMNNYRNKNHNNGELAQMLPISSSASKEESTTSASTTIIVIH